MFDHQHYVPVMRMKPAELRALRDLNPTVRLVTTPLLECPPRVLRGCEKAIDLERRFERMIDHLSGWRGRSLFVDFRTLPSALIAPALETVVARMASIGIRPVLAASMKAGDGSTYTRSIQSIQHKHGVAVCLRISPEELKLSGADALIDKCLRLFGTSPASTDLVVDRGEIEAQSFTYDDFADLIPWQRSWRTITCLAGSFPEDLSRLTPAKIHHLKRHEWRQWRGLQSWPGRRPAFGDYAIQHVLFKEPVAVPNYSASIRYTVDDEFVVLRGEGVLNVGGPGFGQYNGWAKMLTGMPDYFGATFSAGDQYVAERAVDEKSSGSAQTWLQAGFSHHLTGTALQVVGLLQLARRVAATPGGSRWSDVVDVASPQLVV